MSDMRPGAGVPVTIGGIKWHLMFTWAAVDQIQDIMKEPLSKALAKMQDEMSLYKAAGHILTILIEDSLYRNEAKAAPPTYEQVMHMIDIEQTGELVEAILRAYGADLPEADEDDEEDEPEQVNLARLLLIGTTKLGLTENQFWEMTPRKYFRLFDEYITLEGGNTEKEGIDALP